MSNKEHWLNYTSGLSSPDNFIEWSFLYTIGASLQRRVWLGPETQQCFPNTYVILVGEPGIGKGLCIREVADCLKHWQLKDAIIPSELQTNDSFKEAARINNEKNLEEAQENELQMKNKQAQLIAPLLIPVAADATTYAALTKATAEAYKRYNYIEELPDGRKKIKIYGHSSICFVLPELSSLLKKKTDDIVSYLLGIYDCPTDYEYKTKHEGQDRVRRGCINIIAGTTPGFMQTTFNEQLLSEGFTSRTFYIFAQKNRKNQFFIPALSQEQKDSKKIILDHIRKLTSLYGQVQVTQETYDYLQAWWDDQEKHKHLRKNRSLKMIPYYARKNIHVMKVAMMLHFSESTEMFIPLSTFQRAIELLDNEERNMHYAITVDGQNHLSKVTKRIMDFLKSGPKNFVDVAIECHSLAKKSELEEALDFLRETNQISVGSEKPEGQETEVIMYKVKE